MAFAAESFEACMVIGLRYHRFERGYPPIPRLWSVEGGAHPIGPAWSVTAACCDRRVFAPDDGSGRGDAPSSEETAALHITRGVCDCGYRVYTNRSSLIQRLPGIAYEARKQYDALLLADVTAAFEKASIGPHSWRVLAVRPQTIEFYDGYPARLPYPAHETMVELLQNYRVAGVVPAGFEARVPERFIPRTFDGQLDRSDCPACGGPTKLRVKEERPDPLRAWWCDACRCAWAQSGYRPPVRQVVPASEM